MSKAPKIVIPGLNRGAGIPPGYVLGRPLGTGKGPAQLLDLIGLRRMGVATAFVVTASTSLVQSIAHSEVISLSTAVSSSLSSAVSVNVGQSTSLSQISSSLSGVISTNVLQSTSLSQISSSLSGAISSTSSLSTAVSTVDANQSTSISANLSRITSLSTAISTVDSGQTASLSQVSSSLSGAISSTSSLSTAVSTVISGSISAANSRIDSLSTAGGGGGGGSLTLISEQIADGTTGTISFTSIANSYRDLVLVIRGRGDTVANTVNVAIQFNTDTTATNYERLRIGASGTTVSASTANDNVMAVLPAASATANVAGSAEAVIYDYKGTTFHKEWQGRYSGRLGTTLSAFGSNEIDGRWMNTSAITRADAVLAAGNYVSGTVVSLYGRS